MAEAELGKIVSMILENPELVEKIKSMAEASGDISPVGETAAVSSDAAAEAHASPPPQRGSSGRIELLRALRSFVSPERQKGLDTMMTIASVVDTMKTR